MNGVRAARALLPRQGIVEWLHFGRGLTATSTGSAGCALTVDLDHRGLDPKAPTLYRLVESTNRVILGEFFNMAATAADREDNGFVMPVVTGDIGIERFEPVNAAVFHQSLERAIDAEGSSNARILHHPQDVIGFQRRFRAVQGSKHVLLVRDRCGPHARCRLG